jgi:hypothetical protein
MAHTETVPETLGRLAEAVTESAASVRGTGRAELDLMVRRLEALLATFAKTSRALAARPADLAAAPDAATRWLHDLRAATTAVCGWISILRQTDDPAARQRALDAVERNAATIEELLGTVPPRG